MDQTAPVRHRARADVATTKTRPAGSPVMVMRALNIFNTENEKAATAEDGESIHMRALKEYAVSQQLGDPFKAHYQSVTGGEATILPPPFNFYSLLALPTTSNILSQCIDAMVTNVCGHGFRWEYVGPEGGETSTEAETEKKRLHDLFSFPNPDHSGQEMFERMQRDKETLGVSYMEVGRDRQRRVTLMAHIPGHTIRKTAKDREEVDTEVLMPRDGKMVPVKMKRRFRRYVQQIGERKVYFKEFGDPRRIDPSTGKVNEQLPHEESATEILVDENYWPGQAYGMPRWIGQLPAILGSREAELTNLDFFKENAIPALAVLVSGGMVTQASIDDMEQHFAAARGRKSMNRVLFIEAEGDSTAASPDGSIPTPKLELKPLQGERQGDALFQTYDANNQTKVRSAFRLPAIFTGHSQDYTYATAKTSFEVAESQVFGPERNKKEDLVNTKVLPTLETKFWRLKLQAPKVSDPQEVINALTALNGMGAMTPNKAIAAANEMFDLDMKPIEEDWGDWPFAIVTQLVTANRLTGLEGIAEPPPPPPGLTAPGEEADPEERAERTMKALGEHLRALRSAVTGQ